MTLGMNWAQRFEQHQAVRGFSRRTIERRAWSLGLWQEHLEAAGRTLETATAGDLETFLARFPTAQTRYSVRSDLHQLYRFMQRRGCGVGDPTAAVEPPRLPRRAPSPVSAADVRRLLDATAGPVRVAVGLSALAGLRVGEVAALDWADVHLDERVLVVRHGKGGRERVVPVSAELAELLDGGERTGPVVPWSSGQSVAAAIRRAMRRCGIAARPHDLRHSFATQAARRAGGNLVLVAQLLGHASVVTTQRYVGWSPAGAGVVDGLYEPVGVTRERVTTASTAAVTASTAPSCSSVSGAPKASSRASTACTTPSTRAGSRFQRVTVEPFCE